MIFNKTKTTYNIAVADIIGCLPNVLRFFIGLFGYRFCSILNLNGKIFLSKYDLKTNLKK